MPLTTGSMPGIAETVTAGPEKRPRRAVIGRAQVFEQLKNVQAETGRSGDSLAIEIGRRLGTWWVVSGAYQRIGDRIRITSQLVEVLKGTLLRTVKIDGRVSEIFELKDRIVFDLSRSLNVKLGKAEADAIERDETSSVEAFEAYSRGVLNMRTAGATRSTARSRCSSAPCSSIRIRVGVGGARRRLR